MNDDSEDQSSNKSLNNKFELETSTTDTRTKHNENNDSFQASIKDILAGSFRGISQIVVGHPFDTVKVRLQTQKSITSSTTNIINNIKNQQQQQLKYSGLINCITKTFKEENILGFYKGSFSPIVGCSLYSSVLFFSWGRSKKIFEINENESSLIKLGSAGCLTGFIASFIEGPIDLIKSKMQVQYSINHNLNVITKQKNYHFERYKNSLDCIYKISSTHGIRGIFQGLTATICRNTIGTMFYFSSYEVIHQQFSVLLDTDSKSSTPLILLAGGISGLIFWVSIYHFDVVKSKMQTDHLTKSERKYRSMLHCFQSLYRENKIKGFYKGFSACLLRSIPTNGLSFLVYEYCRAKLNLVI